MQVFDKIRARGYRLTRQRRLVLEILEQSQEHLDAETLYARAKERDPAISLATVYRSIAVLKEVGLVQAHRLGEEHRHFETIQESPHYHFTCVNCGQVVEFKAPQLMNLAQKLRDSQGLHVTEISLHLTGTCARCSAGA